MDVHSIRKEFPILRQKNRGKDLIYFDTAATSLKPISVIEAERIDTGTLANLRRGTMNFFQRYWFLTHARFRIILGNLRYTMIPVIH